jgi:hypothetical protein
MFRLFVLGAGFSRAAGLPLGSELWHAVLSEAERLRPGSVLVGDIDRYLKYLADTKDVRLNREEVDIEQFMSFLDIEHALRLTGSDTWSIAGNRTQLLVRYLIAKVLYTRQENASPEAVSLYDSFVAHLEGGDRILTFNYDTLVEEALDRAGKPYRLTPSRFSEIDGPTGKYANGSEHDVTILKLHGSIDWFDARPYQEDLSYRRERGFDTLPHNAVFNNSRVHMTALAQGPYWAESELPHLHRVLNLNEYFYAATPIVDPSPLIVSPSYSKLLYLHPLNDFWNGLDEVGSLNGTLAIIGYSLPSYDEYVRQALYAAVRNFQHYDTGAIIPKTTMRIVDYRPNSVAREEFRTTYRFVDWDRVDSYFDGFDDKAIEMLFAA